MHNAGDISAIDHWKEDFCIFNSFFIIHAAAAAVVSSSRGCRAFA